MARSDVAALLWTPARLAEGLHLLLDRSGLGGWDTSAANFEEDAAGDLGSALENALPPRFELETVAADPADISDVFTRGGPLIARIVLPDLDGPRFALVASSKRGKIRLLGPDHRVHTVGRDEVLDLVFRTSGDEFDAGLEDLLSRIPSSRRRGRALEALRLASAGSRAFGDLWMIRRAPDAPFAARLGEWRAPLRLAGLAVVFAVQYVLTVGSWWLIGRGVFSGHLDGGWLAAWTLMLVTLLAFNLVGRWVQGTLSIDVSLILRRRLLRGLMRLDLDSTRSAGAGRFLGWVLESAVVQELALGGSLRILLAAVEIALTIQILFLGAGGGRHALVFAAWIGLVAWMSWRRKAAQERQTDARLDMTHDLIEKMSGHRTRLAQSTPQQLHLGDDERLTRSLRLTADEDRWTARLEVASLGWLAVGVASVLPVLVDGTASEAAVAVAIGGILLGERAVTTLSAGLTHLGEAWIAWRKVGPIFAAGRGPETGYGPSTQVEKRSTGEGEGCGRDTVLLAAGLFYHPPNRPRPLLDGIDLKIRRGDRIVLEGPSGGGKSTLAALLGGLRTPQSGIVLTPDGRTPALGGTGRRPVVVAPQFGENRLFAESLAFNLLMGRAWPPSADDLSLAEELCGELGLGPLLESMPLGIHQLVGDNGWQLSHGERSRVFIGRALLQDPEVIILDESLGPLDDASRFEVLAAADRRARSLVVIAHP